ncbi:hypothetical protein PVE_P0016 (plasmid) [Pseudomonas veronii 1YdBTEX2]|uniref:Uncharacterized protein n=2 Tax=Pseudomonas veronii TaxID=76761 RepID=A0ABS0VRJ7_PSEVE|nr:hypothetical protein [Pseudomonas veronii]MBI6552635.1 hypothetical protein [Pseudomonas veronii]MBI6652730.1 hypothetical protein [Pseudomonas veronii]SBW85061.1 hypothetical protein PVE_P0016 [Pseudomonas veronii 1YdBTEX2]
MCEVLLKALGPRPDRQVDFFYIAAQLAQGINDGTLPIGIQALRRVLSLYECTEHGSEGVEPCA